jgi:hypothetical protein
MTKTTSKIITAGAFVVSLVIALNPLDFWMNDVTRGVLAASVGVLAVTFASLYFGIRNLDERELAHRATASAIGYSVSIALLVILLLRQILMGEVDSVLIFGLITVIISKSASEIYLGKCC